MTDARPPAAPTTPLGVVAYLTEQVDALGRLTEELERCDARAARAKRAHDVAEAHAYLKADGTVAERHARATLACAELADELAVASVALRAVKARIHEVEERIEVGRSAGATFRAEAATLGYTGGMGR